jgi:hypothetical protein
MDVEERAKLMGWTDQESFKGDPERWTSAEAYVERADNIMPIMKAQMGKYETTIESLKGEREATKKDIKELKETMGKMAKAHTKISEQAYDKALGTIRAEQTKAITDGDGDKWNELEKDKDDLLSNKPEVVEVQSPQEAAEENPDYKSWVSENPWYESNQKLKKYADSVVYGKSQMTGKKGRDLMDTVSAEVREMFPEEFENPNRNDAAAVSGGTSQGAVVDKTKKTTYSDLPQDAKDACNGYVEQGLGTKEDYIAIYEE